MHGVAKWLTPAVTLGVAVFIIMLLIDVNEAPSMTQESLQQRQESDQPKNAVQEKRWIDTLATSERQGYFYPVNEIYINIDLNQKLVNEKIYRLSAKLHDPYQLFCLKQELKRHQLRHTLKSDSQNTQFIVYTKEKARIDALVDAMKNYNISVKHLPYQEDHQWKNIK
jgi:superfamily II DNA/RNA helicase